MQQTFTEKQFDTGEIILNYAEGSAVGTPLVLLHGGTRWWRDWLDIIGHLQPNWHIYAPDLRGHGKSGRDADHYRLPDFARDIVAFLRREVREPVVLVGHSLGAMTAIGTAAEAPEAVRGLMLLDPPLFNHRESVALRPDLLGWFNHLYQLTTSVSSYEEMVEHCRSFMGDAPEAAIRQMASLFYGLAPEMLDTARRDLMLKGYDLQAALERIACPTLIIQADWERGGAMREVDAAFAREHIPNLTIVKIPDTGHQLQSEQAERVAQELEHFFQKA